MSSYKEKGRQFGCRSGHMPGWWVWSLTGAHARGNWSVFLSLSFSLPISKKLSKFYLIIFLLSFLNCGHCITGTSLYSLGRVAQVSGSQTGIVLLALVSCHCSVLSAANDSLDWNLISALVSCYQVNSGKHTFTDEYLFSFVMGKQKTII